MKELFEQYGGMMIYAAAGGIIAAYICKLLEFATVC